MRINIRGVIVDSSYDVDYMLSYIQRGIITPESYFRKQLEIAAKSNETADVLVSSYGGNVIAGNDMIVAFKEFSGKKTVTVGAFAASMAANFVLNCGVDVKCYKNSQFLFHGASCITYGGADALQDSADWLTKINEPIINKLIELGVPEERVRDGFAEGREMILSADEALEYGIVSKIIDADADQQTKVSAKQATQLASLGMPQTAIAALTSETDIEAELEAKVAQATRELEALKKDLEVSQGESRKVQSAADKRLQALQDEADKRVEELQAQMQEQQAGAEARYQTLLNDYDALNTLYNSNLSALETSNTEIQTLKQQISVLENAHSTLVGGVLLETGEAEMSWPKLVARYGLADALKLFPAKAEAFKKSHNK